MGGYNSLPFSPSGSNAARNPVLENIDKAAATGDLSILGPREHEAIKRSGITLAPPAATPSQITNPSTPPPSIGQPSAAPAMPLTEGGIRGNAANNFNTSLAPGEEPQYQTWKSQYAPKDSGEDYDLQGAYKYGLTPDPKTGHWSDRFKKPNEPTFSNESQYAQDAPEKAGHWNGDTYVPPAAAAPAAITNPARTPQPQAVPPTAAEAPIRGELQRLTAPPPSDPSLAHTKQNTGTAGVNQIHNPWARIPLQILGAVGETFAPRLAAALPGTESHHQMLVGEAEGALKQQQEIRKAEEEAQTEAATAGHLQAQTRLANTQADVAQEESKKNVITLGPNQGAFDLKTGTWLVEPTLKDEEKTTEIDPEIGKQLGIKPTAAGRYLVPNQALGALLKKKEPTEGEMPLGERIPQLNQLLGSRYAVLHKGPIPASYQLPPNATQKDYDRIHQALQSEEAGHQSELTHQDNLGMQRATLGATESNRRTLEFDRAYDRLHTQLNNELTPVNQQLDNIQEARRLINSGGVGQALGTIKTIVAVAGGKGSNVRVTGAELNSIPAARGLPGGFDQLINNLMGSGKLTGETQRQVDEVLAQVEEIASRKQAMVNGVMDRATSAKTPDELRKIEQDYRHQAQTATQQQRGGGTVPEVKTEAEYNALPSGSVFMQAGQRRKKP